MKTKTKLLTEQDKKIATYWYAVKGYDLVTIAQHFGLTVEQIKSELNHERQ